MATFAAFATTDILITVAYLALGTAIFVLADLGARLMFMQPTHWMQRLGQREVSRKFAHIGCGLALAALPYWGGSKWSAAAIGAFMGLGFKYGRHFLDKHQLFGFLFAQRQGSTIYAFTVVIMAAFFFEQSRVFQLGFLVLALADPAAAIAGTLWGRRRFADKTLLGSCAHGGVAALILGVSLFLNGGWRGLGFALVLACIITLCEAFARKGWDNFWIPVITASGLNLWMWLM